MDSQEIDEAIATLTAIRDEYVDMALSGNIAREHHLIDALHGFRTVTLYQEVIQDLREWKEDNASTDL